MQNVFNLKSIGQVTMRTIVTRKIAREWGLAATEGSEVENNTPQMTMTGVIKGGDVLVQLMIEKIERDGKTYLAGSPEIVKMLDDSDNRDFNVLREYGEQLLNDEKKA